METITIDFLMGPDWTSRWIAWFGQGPHGWSHCASLLKDGRYLDARNDELGGVKPGVHFRQPSTEAWIRKRRATLEVTAAEYKDWEDNLIAKVGDFYAQRDILGYFLNKDLHRSGTYDCSALVINALQHIKKVPFPLPVPAHQITPNAALLIVATAGFTIGDVELAA
jgi:hypothetical protein